MIGSKKLAILAPAHEKRKGRTSHCSGRSTAAEFFVRLEYEMVESKVARITILVVLLAIVLIGAHIYSAKNPPMYCSKGWTQVDPREIETVTLIPVEYRYYSRILTLSEPIEVQDNSLGKTIVSAMDGQQTWLDFMSLYDHWGHLREFNIKIDTSDGKTFIFRLKFYMDDSFIWYSELRADSYSQPGDLQKTYGDTKASADLADAIKQIIAERGIGWVPAYTE